MPAPKELRIAQERGDAVISLLERAAVSPVPAFYGLAYDYVAGVQSLSAIRMGGYLQAPSPDASVGEQLYQDFVRPYETDATLEAAAAKMAERLSALDYMLDERQQLAWDQADALASVGAAMATTPPSVELMKDWVVRLERANEEACEASGRLSAELEATSSQLDEIRAEVTRLSKDAVIDPVTHVANRAGLDGSLAAAIATARSRMSGKLALLVIDVDQFKRINDMYGHQVGDDVLRAVAKSLLAGVRNDDVVGRMGGDEFVLLLHDTGPSGASVAAESLREAVVECDLRQAMGPAVLGHVTVSIGIANYRDGDTIGTLFDRADRCLFAAKREGRNRVVADGPGDEVNAA